MEFDIRTPESATQTLTDLTGIPNNFWIYESYLSDGNIDSDYLYNIIEKYNGNLPFFDEIYLIISHITTSANACAEIAENGIGDLQSAYKNTNSELRLFLDAHNVEIQLDYSRLIHNGINYSIEYDSDNCPRDDDSLEYKGWSVGRKLYFDNGLCGFFVINPELPYGGNVHERPEILNDIDILLESDLSNEWKNSHSAYEVVFKVHSYDLELYEHNDDDNEAKVMRLLLDAFYVMCSDSAEIYAQLKPDVQITSDRIIDIHPFDKW